MAIIYSYPEKSSPSGGDFLVITDSEQTAPNKNRTKSLKLSDLADFVISSKSGITGGGTVNTIAMFTPTGGEIGNSNITQAVSFGGLVTTSVSGDLTASRIITSSYFGTNLTISNIQCNTSLINAGISNFNGVSTFNSGATFNQGLETDGDVEIGYLSDSDAFTVNSGAGFYNSASFFDTIRDGTGAAGTAGQVLSSTGTGVAWVTNGNGTVTGTGNTNKIPRWSDGQNGVLGDSIITQSGTTIIIAGNLSSGDSNSLSGNFSAAFGFNNTVTGNRSGGLGANNTVAGGQVWATGDGNDVGIDLLNVGGNIVTSGFNNNVKSGNSCVVGTGNTLTNTIQSAGINTNFVLGSANTLNDVMDGIAIGFNNTINNNDSCIFGKNNTTSATDTYAVGKGNTLTSINDYAFGLNNNISGNGVIAMAIGQANVLAGKQSYAFGRELVDGGQDDTVILGRFNAAPTATGRIVFGTGFNDTTGRKNAIEIQAGNGTTSGLLFSALRISASYNSNAEATAGGVENAELYRSNNQVRINTNQTQQDARNNEGFIFLTPRVKIISSGDSFNYDANYNLLKLNWSGADGTATVVLPNANTADTKNRVLQCLTDGTFNANISINFNNSGGLINGSTTKTITGAYQSIKFWSDGIQWYILNE